MIFIPVKGLTAVMAIVAVPAALWNPQMTNWRSEIKRESKAKLKSNCKNQFLRRSTNIMLFLVLLSRR